MTAETGDTETQETIDSEATETDAEEQTTPEGNAGEEAPVQDGSDPIQLPEEHPLVKTLAAQKELIKELKKRPAGDEPGKVDELTQELDNLRKENEALRVSQLRATVAADKGVPAQLLVGSTKDELESFADALVEFRGQTASGGLRRSPGQGINSGSFGDGGRSADEIVNAAYQRD